MRRPHQIVAVDDMGGAKMKRPEEDKVAKDGENSSMSVESKLGGDVRLLDLLGARSGAILNRLTPSSEKT